MAQITSKAKDEKPSPGHPMLPEPMVIRRLWWETKDTFSIELGRQADERPFTFLPGQFNMLYVFGIGEIPISISGDPNVSRTLIHTIRVVGTVTKAMAGLRKGEVIGVRGPFGTGWPVKEALGQDVLIVAGGIGLAPLRPVIYEVLANRERFGRLVVLYGTRTPGDLLYRRQMEKWRARLDFDLLVTVDRAGSDWRGNVGVVTRLISRASFDTAHVVAMVCGPEVMMRFTATELINRGISPQKIYVSLERNMRCGIGLCGHCQIGPCFVCQDGPVYSYAQVKELLGKREI